MIAYKILSRILTELSEMVRPGINVMDLENKGTARIMESGSRGYNLGYYPISAKTPYPANFCISVNSTIAHGIPRDYVFQDGDIVSIDTAIQGPDGDLADGAIMAGAGKLANKDERLIYYAKKTLLHAVSLMKAGEYTGDIAREIEQFALLRGYKVNRRFAGHRIGKEMHERPNIYNTTESSHTYGRLRSGEIYCIEPMITYGKDDLGIIGPDGWSTYTSDGKNSAFFECMVEVTENGCNMLTEHIKIN